MSLAAQKAVEYFVSAGWTRAHAAGIAANLQAESSFRPDAVGDGGLAYGLAQWHPDRQANFERAFGGSIKGSSLDEQLAFVQWELTNTEKRAGDLLRACTTAADAGACVSKYYERPADRDGEAKKRAALAMQIAGEPAPQPATPPITSHHKEPRMGATLLAGLIPSILSLFSDRAQAAISKATGASPDVAAKFTADIAQQIQAVSGVAVTDQASAIKAVAEVASNPAKVAVLEQHASAFVLAEIGGGIQGAAEEYAAINRDLDDDVWWRIPFKFLFNMQNVVTLAFLAGVGYFVPPLAKKVDAMSAEAAMGLIVLIFAVIGVVSGRWLRLTPKEKE